MGIAKSSQFDRFDRSNFLSTSSKKLPVNSHPSLNENLRESKHLPEYPPLIICKDSHCQTTQSFPPSSSVTTYSSFSFHNLTSVNLLNIKNILLIGLVYFSICLIACLSNSFQTAMVYMNFVNFPFESLSNLESYGLPNGRNIQFLTEDGMMIRGWHLLPPGEISWNASQYQKKRKERDQYFNKQLQTAEMIIIQLHGNAANRGVSRRIALMKQLASEFSAHVIAIDYRGFGDSTGIPSEIGTTLDMFGLWKWLEMILLEPQRQGQKIPPIIIYSLSLGTGIAVDFLHHATLQQQLQLQSQPPSAVLHVRLSNYTPPLSLYPAGLILASPFSSISDAIHDYPYSLFFRIIPFVFHFV
jgi:abhydrolase domain-containing protein 12